MKICRKALGCEKRGDFVSVRTDGTELRIWFLTDEIIRIRAGFDGDFAERSYSLVMTAWDDAMDEVEKDYRHRVTCAAADGPQEEENAWVIRGRKLTVRVEKDPFRICVCGEDGHRIHADIPDLAYMEDSNHRRIHTSEISPDDCFFGFGEKSGEFNKAQTYMSMSPKDAMGYDAARTDSLYKHIPFYIRLNRKTREACGYFYHNTAECDFDMGREKSNYWHMHSRYRADDGDIDLFLITGPAVKDVVKRYTDLTGKSAMLPRYALGYLGSSMYYPELPADCDDAIIDFIDYIKEEGIPVDGFQLSSGYTQQETAEGLKRCVFTWNRKRFKDPADFFAQMKKRGVVVSPNVKPGVLLVHPDLPKMKEHGIFVKDAEGKEDTVGTWWGGPGNFADFTNPETRTYWKEMLKEGLLQYGCESVWNDNCEYDSIVDKDSRCFLEGAGTTIGHIKAVMSNLMCQVTAEAIHEVYGNLRPYIVCRSGHCGIQRYAQTWAGDNETCWETLKYNIATILGMSLSGVANQGCDIGGFHGTSPEPELFVRWVQNGIFQPRFSIHSVNTDNTVTEPWMYGGCKDLIRDAIRLRYRLMPYYYSLMERASETGEPIMTPMCYEFQQDPKCYEEGVDFMVGDSLLVANVVEKGQTVRPVYLPAGETFYDVYTRVRYEGGQTIEVPVNLASIPMFLRSGGIVPSALNQTSNLMTEKETAIRLLMAPDKDASFTLYEDDGLTEDYRSGAYRKTKISVRAGVHTAIRFACEGSYRTAVEQMVLDVIHREKAPFYVTVDDRQIPHFLHRRNYEESDCGWYYSQTLRSVQIRYPNPKKDYEVDISFEEFDMIGM